MSFPEPGPEPASGVHATERSTRWFPPLLVAALVVGLAGVGIGMYAVATTPAATSGPRGPVGNTGQQGPQGPAGPVGPEGSAGSDGSAGTLASTSVVAETSLMSPPNPPVGTVLVAKSSCPDGKLLLSGGAQVSAPGLVADRNVELRSSFPLNVTIWENVAIVTGPLGAGVAMSMKPYVVCGQAATGTKATTTTTAP